MTEQLKRREFCMYCQKRHEIPDNLAEDLRFGLECILTERVYADNEYVDISALTSEIISHLKERVVL